MGKVDNFGRIWGLGCFGKIYKMKIMGNEFEEIIKLSKYQKIGLNYFE